MQLVTRRQTKKKRTTDATWVDGRKGEEARASELTMRMANLNWEPRRLQLLLLRWLVASVAIY